MHFGMCLDELNFASYSCKFVDPLSNITHQNTESPSHLLINKFQMSTQLWTYRITSQIEFILDLHRTHTMRNTTRIYAYPIRYVPCTFI